MLRRHVYSQELRYEHEHSPRKWRSFQPGGQFKPTTLYRRQEYRPPAKEHNWIGKTFIPAGSFTSGANTIHEREIMRAARMYSYRIIYANPDGSYKSKIRVESRPEQLNIVLDFNNTIIDVIYF